MRKSRHGFTLASKVAQVPDFHKAVVAAGHYEGVVGVPIDDVDVACMGVVLRQHARLAWICPNVPHFERLITRARHQDIRLIGTPSDILNTGCVGGIGLLTDRPGASTARLPHMDPA